MNEEDTKEFTIPEKYYWKFCEFTWNDKNKTVGQYREYVKKMLVRYEKEIKKEFYNELKELLK